jgi:hypothetical protein
MNSLTFATSSNKDDIFGGFKPSALMEEHKSAGRVQEQPKLVSLGSKNSNNASSDGGIALFGLAKQAAPTEVKSLNAKKLDVNFDADDFFNSFQPTAVAAAPTTQAKPTTSTKL